MKKHTLALLLPCSVLLAGVTNAQPLAASQTGVLVNADPTKPPPYLDVPGDPRPSDGVDAETAAINPAVRALVNTGGRAWALGAGREFSPSLAYLHGVPTIMIMTRATEPADIQARRFNAIVSACEFMLADAAFGKAVVCIATYDPKATQVMSTRNVTITRDAFQTASRKYGKSLVLTAAISALHKDATSIQQICSELGIK